MSKAQISTIPYTRKVYYAAYAALPIAGIKQGDLGYATDRLIFYRWSGAAWQAVTIHSSSGIAANKPNAADLPNGSLYFETDTSILKQVQAGAWVAIVTPPASALTVAETEVFNSQVGSSGTWEDLNLSGTIGAKSTLVLLKVTTDNAAESHFAVRKKGETDQFYMAADLHRGLALAEVSSDCHAVFLVVTDTSGIIQICGSSASVVYTIKVMAYIK